MLIYYVMLYLFHRKKKKYTVSVISLPTVTNFELKYRSWFSTRSKYINFANTQFKVNFVIYIVRKGFRPKSKYHDRPGYYKPVHLVCKHANETSNREAFFAIYVLYETIIYFDKLRCLDS